ncbi:MAG: D-alanyl-D-alanine carboxypeptidase [Peptococcaceae bacterium]|nr:D-alanyl-D-alanine carboxypeptidase [Peptococcaceae bacterium]
MSKYTTRLIISVFLFVFLISFTCQAEEIDEVSIETSKMVTGKWTLPYVSAHSAILIDTQTGDILYERDAYKKRPPASTTKVLTAITALDLAGVDEISTVSEKADRVGESSIYLSKGNKLALGELIEGALIRSGNDACVAIAEQIAGSMEEFIRLMNLKAVSLGAFNSNFVNPHGLPDKDHYSTAYDLAVIARYAMKNPVFAKTVAQQYGVIEYNQPHKSQQVKNTNKLLWSYPLADGIKTGTTNAAGKCLIASATKEGRRLICVLLNAPDRFGDAHRLLEWGFNHTEIYTLGKKGDQVGTYRLGGRDIPAVLGSDVVICIEKEKKNMLKEQALFHQNIRREIKAGDILGYYNIFIGDKLIKQAMLVSPQDYKGSPWGILNFKDFFPKTS